MATFKPGKDPGRCCARVKSSTADNPKRCRQRAVAGRNVCRVHGGKAGRPIIHGRYSKFVKNGGVAKAHQAALALDKEQLWDMEDHMRVMETNCQVAAQRVEDRDTPEFRARLKEMSKQVWEDYGKDDKSEFLESYMEMARLINDGVREDRAVESWVSAVERKAKRLEEAWKIRLTGAQTINVRDLVVILHHMMGIVERKTDEKTATEVRILVEREIMATGKAPA